MNRRVPEFALVTGAFLALTLFAAGVALADDPLPTAMLAVGVLYPFAAYAVHHSDDPTGVLPPRAVLVLGALGGLLVCVEAVRPLAGAAGRLAFGMFLGLGVALPPAAYAARYGPPARLPGPVVVAGGALAGAGVLLLGLATDAALYGGADALLIWTAAGVDGRRRGVAADRRTRRAAVVVGALLGLLVAGYGLLAAARTADWLVVAVVAVLGPGLYAALTGEEFA